MDVNEGKGKILKFKSGYFKKNNYPGKKFNRINIY
jgi:hypothetical protein